MAKFEILSGLFTRRRMACFWNYIKSQRSTKVKSNFIGSEFQSHFSNIITYMDDTPESEMAEFQHAVLNYYKRHGNSSHFVDINAYRQTKCIEFLNKNSSPGIDGITSAHFSYGSCEFQNNIFTTILAYRCIPARFTTDVIVLILKTSTLYPKDPIHYQPITISTTHSKILELPMTPNTKITDTQNAVS